MKPLEEFLTEEDHEIFDMLSDDLNIDIEELILLLSMIGLKYCMEKFSYEDFKVFVLNSWLRKEK